MSTRREDDRYSFEVLMNSIRDGVVIIDRELRVIEANQNFINMLGYSEKELHTLRAWDWHSEMTKQDLRSLLGKLSSISKCFETTYKCKDGRAFEAEVSVTGAFFAGEQTYICVFRDITDRKQAEIALQESEKKYRTLLDNLPVGVYRVTPGENGEFLMVNRAFLDIFGFESEQELKDMNMCDLYYDAAERKKASDQVIENDCYTSLELKLRRKDGTIIWCLDTAHLIKDEAGAPLYFDCILEDITARKEAENKYRSLMEEYEKVFNGTQDALFLVEVVDQDTVRIMRTNKTHQEKTGTSLEKIMGKTPRELLGPETGRQVENNYRQCIKKGSPFTYEETLDLPGGKCVWQTTLTPVFQDGRPAYIVGSSQDITEKKKYEEKLQYLSLHDSLTGLYNRAFFEEEMNRLEAGRDYPISIIVADLDGLKKINDSMGHAMGDELLKTCAEILCRSLRQSDILARVGGDEFTVLLPNTDIAVSREITERIRARIKEHNESDPRLSLSLSIGVATAERKDGSLENTYSTADNRMYQDKISRRQSKE